MTKRLQIVRNLSNSSKFCKLPKCFHFEENYSNTPKSFKYVKILQNQELCEIDQNSSNLPKIVQFPPKIFKFMDNFQIHQNPTNPQNFTGSTKIIEANFPYYSPAYMKK